MLLGYSLVVWWKGVSLETEVTNPQLSSVVNLAENGTFN